MLSRAVHAWSYTEFEGRGVTTADALARAMRAKPHLRVEVGCGWFYGATPFAAAEHTLARLVPIPPRPVHLTRSLTVPGAGSGVRDRIDVTRLPRLAGRSVQST